MSFESETLGSIYTNDPSITSDYMNFDDETRILEIQI